MSLQDVNQITDKSAILSRLNKLLGNFNKTSTILKKMLV